MEKRVLFLENRNGRLTETDMESVEFYSGIR